MLPTWYDTFDYATKVEYLGIGIYGNKHAINHCQVDFEQYHPPSLVEAEEFGRALLTCVGKRLEDAEAQKIRQRAEKLGRLCQISGGRFESARIIADLSTI